MDTFMDKLAQKTNAQEIIKANLAADAAQLEQMQVQLAQYNACLQEMRNLQMKNSEITNWMKEDLSKAAQSLDDSVKKLEERSRTNRLSVEGMEAELSDVRKRLRTELEDMRGQLQNLLDKPEALDKETVAELFRQSDEFNHKEDVKVYRNVQAAVVDENAKQLEQLADLLAKNQRKTLGRMNAALVFAILAFMGSVSALVLYVLQMMNFKLF